MESVLSKQVLVLNRFWQAVNICSVRRALTLLFEGHAEVVLPGTGGEFHTYDFSEWRDMTANSAPHAHECVHTISFKVRVPKVILLLFFDRLPKKEVKFTRHNIFERDKNTCQYCNKVFDRRDLNIDHIIPRDRGGKTTWENVACSCIPCNTRKGNKLLHEVGMRLIRKPKRPKWRPFISVTVHKTEEESWKHFLDLAYWNVELGEEVG